MKKDWGMIIIKLFGFYGDRIFMVRICKKMKRNAVIKRSNNKRSRIMCYKDKIQ